MWRGRWWRAAPFVRDIVRGELLEQSFMTAMTKAVAATGAFFTRPIAGTLGVLTLAVWAAVARQALRASRPLTAA